MARQDLLNRRGVDLDARNDAAERAEPQIHQSLCRGVDEHDISLDGFRRHMMGKDLPGWNVARCARLGLVNRDILRGMLLVLLPP